MKSTLEAIQENVYHAHRANLTMTQTADCAAFAAHGYIQVTIKYDDVISFEALMQAGNECRKGVMWKSSTQMFKINQIRWAAQLHEQSQSGTYRSKGFTNFMIIERGKSEAHPKAYIYRSDACRSRFVKML